MPTYVYETIPKQGKPKRFELWQSMKDAALTKHPETGEPVRRLIVGGADLFTPHLIVERPQPPPPKKSRFQKKKERSDDGPRHHYDHGDDHHH
jgi:hypothetical protein